jgi:hypothetical protein
MDLGLVPDATGIDRVAQQMMDMPARESVAACLAAFASRALSTAKLQIVRFDEHTSDGAVLLIKIIERSDGLCFCRVDLERPAICVIAKGHLPAHPQAPALRLGYNPRNEA